MFQFTAEFLIEDDSTTALGFPPFGDLRVKVALTFTAFIALYRVLLRLIWQGIRRTPLLT